MRTALLVGGCLLGAGMSAHAADESYRLAHAKSENVEVFVDHPAGQPWCGPSLRLRFAFSGPPSQDTVERLMPKLGGLLGAQCPQAETAQWQSVDAGGRRLAQGTAGKASAWVPQTVSAASALPVPAASQPLAAPGAALPTAITGGAGAAVNFSVSGWTPPLESDVLAGADFIKEYQDQNGCRYRTTFAPPPGQSVVLESTGVRCGSDGYADGPGALSIRRTDGVQLRRYERASFHRGLPLIGGELRLPVVGFDGEKSLLFLLHSDPQSRVHYLLRAHYASEGYWGSQQPYLFLLTENIELFRQYDSIRGTLLAAPKAYEAVRKNPLGYLPAAAVRDFDGGVVRNSPDSKLYEVELRRDREGGQWEFEPNRAKNHLFEYERKQAEIAKREAERRAREEEQERQRAVREEQRQRQERAYKAQEQLRRYETLRAGNSSREQLMQALLDDISPQQYAQLLTGGGLPVRQIVRITGKSGDAWKLDWPYQAELKTQADVEKGWYLIQASISVDPERSDDEGLPMTLFAGRTMLRCAKDGCTDQLTPLTLMRLQLNDPKWTPEEAEDAVRAMGGYQ